MKGGGKKGNYRVEEGDECKIVVDSGGGLTWWWWWWWFHAKMDAECSVVTCGEGGWDWMVKYLFIFNLAGTEATLVLDIY